MDIKLTNGKKIITKDKKYYEGNLAHFTKNGFFPVQEKQTKSETKKDISGKVVQLKTKKKKTRKKNETFK